MSTMIRRTGRPGVERFQLLATSLFLFLLPHAAVGETSFTEIKKFTGLDTEAVDRFGVGLDINGTLLAIGGHWADAPSFRSGAVYLFRRDAGGPDYWGQFKKLTAADSAPESNFGHALAISGNGNTLVVGAAADDEYGFNAGAAYVFDRNAGGIDNWGQVRKVVPLDIAALDNFYTGAVSFDGNTMVGAGHRNDDLGSESGAVYIFERNEGGPNNWGQTKKILASDGRSGDLFGAPALISGDTVAVGAWPHDAAGTDTGAVYLYERNLGGADNWGESRKLVCPDVTGGDAFGGNLSIENDTLLVGATRHADSRGAAYIFYRNTGGPDNWGLVRKLTAPDGRTNDLFGSSVRLVGDLALVGAIREDGESGALYVFRRDAEGPDHWGFVQKIKAKDADAGDRFGSLADISDDTLVVSALYDDAAGTDSGAAYIFRSDSNGLEPVGGAVTGLVLSSVECANLNNGQTVNVPVEPGQSTWNCNDSGLEVAPGDRVIMTVDSTVPRDGDLNRDGCIDRADLTVILDFIRATGTFYNAGLDLNDDGLVNIADARALVLLFDNLRGAPCN